MRAEEYQRRREELAGWPVGIVSYRLGEHFVCEVDNVTPGARIARGEGGSREEAERAALRDAERRLGRTRVHGPEG
ncbi:MAG TPA: hypothetical protein VFZ01_06490 [Geminicoccaceae bacterium]